MPARVLLIIGAIIIILSVLAYLLFETIFFVDVMNTAPDPEATIDPVGIAKAAYVVLTIIFTVIGAILHVIGTAFSAIGLVLNAGGQRVKSYNVWGALQIAIPLIVYIIGFASIFIIQVA
jgi:hypothetical protein